MADNRNSSSTGQSGRGKGANGGFGGRGRGNSRGRGRGRGGGGRGGFGAKRQWEHKKENTEMKRPADDDYHSSSKRQRTYKDDVIKENPFSKEEIEAEQRRPKRKVAVMVGYAGTGYKGMQVNGDEPTIERDLFRAFIEGEAISKANANDPKKSSLMRCARTDKGVHAAGNVISLKLIIEDEDVVAKINAALPPQIRVWGIERAANSFNCYHACDSRWYEYLMPSYCLLPPHPQTFLGKKVPELAKEHGTEEELEAAMADVKDFWADVDENEVKPILAKLDPEVRATVLEQLSSDEFFGQDEADEPAQKTETTETEKPNEEAQPEPDTESKPAEEQAGETEAAPSKPDKKVLGPVDYALRDVKSAYIGAKKRYRVSESRLKRLQDVLDKYEGTNNFHNFTVQKPFRDPSAKRHIKSFVANPKPIIINDTEWLSLKVHGQSFMMHQIRKMVGLASLVVRCGTSLDRVDESYQQQKMAIPKAPGLGLLLERPVFSTYSIKAEELGRAPIDFGKYEEEMDKFKQEQIYNRIFEVEEKESAFHSFFNQIDQFKQNHFLWVTAGGLKVAELTAGSTQVEVDKQLGDEDEDAEGGEG